MGAIIDGLHPFMSDAAIVALLGGIFALLKSRADGKITEAEQRKNVEIESYKFEAENRRIEKEYEHKLRLALDEAQRDFRVELSEEIKRLSDQLKESQIAADERERELLEFQKRAVMDEAVRDAFLNVMGTYPPPKPDLPPVVAAMIGWNQPRQTE